MPARLGGGGIPRVKETGHSFPIQVCPCVTTLEVGGIPVIVLECLSWNAFHQ